MEINYKAAFHELWDRAVLHKETIDVDKERYLDRHRRLTEEDIPINGSYWVWFDPEKPFIVTFHDHHIQRVMSKDLSEV